MPTSFNMTEASVDLSLQSPKSRARVSVAGVGNIVCAYAICISIEEEDLGLARLFGEEEVYISESGKCFPLG